MKHMKQGEKSRRESSPWVNSMKKTGTKKEKDSIEEIGYNSIKGSKGIHTTTNIELADLVYCLFPCKTWFKIDIFLTPMGAKPIFWVMVPC